MKKKMVFLLVMALVLELCGCGQRENSTEPSADVFDKGSSMDSLTVIADSPLANGESTLQYQMLDFPSYAGNPQNIQLHNDRVYFLSQDETYQYACQMNKDGSDISATKLIEKTDTHYVSCIAFCDKLICYSSVEYILSSDGQLSSMSTLLTCISNDGTERFSIDINGAFGDENGRTDTTVADIVFASDQTVLFTTPYMLYRLNQKGEILNSISIENQAISLVSSGAGAVFLLNLQEPQELYSFDEETFTIGRAVLNCESMSGIYPGTDNYDFFAVYEDGVCAIELNAHKKELLIPSSAMDGIGKAFPIDDQKWLISHTNYINFDSSLYVASEVPADNTKEPTTLTLAISSADNFDDYVQRVLTQYNFENQGGKIAVQPFSDEELKLAVVSGDVPDLILFDNMQNWESISLDLLAKRSLLEDLTPYFDSDENLSLDSILPGVLTAMKSDSGIFSIPYGYQYRTIYCRNSYEVPENWSLADLIETTKNLPDGVVIEETTQSDFLNQVMQWCLNDFADERAGTCNFETKLFYDLLAVCKDKMPAGTSENTAPADEYLCNYAFSAFGFDSLCKIIQQTGSGVTFAGFPDANGGQFGFSPQIAMTTSNRNPSATWSFIRMLLMSDGINIYEPILTSYFERDIQSLLSDYPQEIVDKVSTMIMETNTASNYTSTIPQIVVEEASAYFAGDKTATEVASIIQNRVMIFLSEQS